MSPVACLSFERSNRNQTTRRTYTVFTTVLKYSVIGAATFLVACGGGDSDPVVVVPPTSQEPALDAAKAFLAKYDALVATSFPATGAAATALHDGCFLNDGMTKAWIVDNYDTDPKALASEQYNIGSTRTNVKVLDDRLTKNADGTERREIDITYDVNYKDGSKNQVGTKQTIISGSSTGSKLPNGKDCTTAESKPDWRHYGNRKIVEATLTAFNERLERTVLATGAPMSPAVVYSKYISLNVVDPANVATYATITGPGLGIGTNFGKEGTLKLISVRLLRESTDMAGKPGNYVDWRDTDGFRVCQNTARNNYAPADIADCLGDGGTNNSWGYYRNADAAALDTGFSTLNIKAGDVYTFKIYNDDGWKTVNGQASKTPIATYTATLNTLPLNAADLAGTGVSADKFARVTSASKTAAEIAAAVRGKTSISIDLAWSLPGAMPDARPVALSYVSGYQSGQANATGASWPASRKSDTTYPVPTATSTSRSFFTPATALVTPTYSEVSIAYSNRNRNLIRSIYTFQ